MKEKTFTKLMGVLFVASVICWITAIPKILKSGPDKNEVRPNKMVIEKQEKSTDGVLTIYASDGSVFYQCQSDSINIVNDGINGEDVFVELYLPNDK